jgi:hypothetical protein
MNLRNIGKVIVLAVSLAVVAGCGGDRQLPSGRGPTGSIDDQIKAVQNNPNMPPQQKAMVIGQLQLQAKAKPGTPQ